MSSNEQIRKILFVTYGGSHVDIVRSLIPSIDAHPGLDYQILALTIAGKKLETFGCRFFRCKDYFPLKGYESALEIGAKLSKNIWHESTGIPFEDSCAYLGVSMLDLIYDLGEEEGWKSFKEKNRKSFMPTRFLSNILDIEKPDIVVTTCHVRMERAANTVALQRGITSVRIEDMLGYSIFGNVPISQKDPILNKSEWPDYIIVPNEFTLNRFLKAGFEQDRVIALGQPFLDNWVQEFQSENLKNTRMDFLSKNKPRITYMTPARQDVLYDQSKEILKLATQREDWDFVFKLHPSVIKSVYLGKVPPPPANVAIIDHGDLQELVNLSSVIITFKSTVGYLGALSGIPLIILNCTGDPDTVPYVQEGAATGVYRYSNLEEAIEISLDPNKSSAQLSPVLEIIPDAAKKITEFFATIPLKS